MKNKTCVWCKYMDFYDDGYGEYGLECYLIMNSCSYLKWSAVTMGDLRYYIKKAETCEHFEEVKDEL